MDANDFVAKLKADGTGNDLCDLDEVHKNFKSILSKLAARDRGPFSLNILCVLCRNLDKVPTWRSVIDNQALVMLSIDCVRETRCLDKPERVKTLACVYHIHRHVVKWNTPIPPELVLKLSYMPFEVDVDNLLREYFKTYWNILSDRILYIEKLKLERLAVNKLLSKLIEDIQKIIQIYDTVNFCTNILVFLLKKLHFIYNDINSVELHKAFGKIFECLSTKNDLKSLKKLSEKDSLDLYVKLLDCLYVIAENESKVNFKNSVLSTVTKTCITFLGHNSDIFHCLQTFFLNAFCCILTEKPDLLFTETILANILNSCTITEKLGYKKAMTATYPYLNQFLRLYIEYSVANCETKKWTDNFTDQIQECCLKLMLHLMGKLRDCEQLLKCENCMQKSGLHDALRLSFQTKYFVSISLTQGVDIAKVLPTLYSVVIRQYEILVNLCSIGCMNYEKCYKKLQADVHNTAILLNKSQFYEYSIKLFDVYLHNEIKHFKDEIEMKNISRALYNKSICELDCRKHENALKSAYLSLIFALPDSLNADKHMSLVMEIKAKALKWKTDDNIQDDENQDDLQLMTVWNACLMSVDDHLYGNLKPFFCSLKFGELLRHEFASYVRLWPSIIPVAGVWRSLHGLIRDKPISWLKAKQDGVLELLYEIVLETPTAVRTINSEYYSKIVAALLEDLEKNPPNKPDYKVIYATLLILKSEYDLHEASLKYEWKVAETPNSDPDQVPSTRTMPQEHVATQCAITAVHIYMGLVKEFDKVSQPLLRSALQTAQVCVPLLLHLCRNVEGLQMADICCKMAAVLEDREAYVRNAGTILYHASKPDDVINALMTSASRYCSQLLLNKETMETALVFMCDCAIYSVKCGALGVAAKLARLAQARILEAYEAHGDIKLDLSVGRLLEAQILACQECGPTALSAANAVQRHYLSVSNSGSKWTHRRLYALTLKHHIATSTLKACVTSRALLWWRRARAAAAGGAAGGAGLRASIHAAVINTGTADDCQTKIDNRIKHILGLQPSNETQPYCQNTESKTEPFTPKQELETMLKSVTLKKTQVSPSLPCFTVPGFKVPEFIEHDCTCQCYACQIPICQILACQVSGFEASMYFRAKEFDIARNYFDGALKCFGMFEAKLGRIIKNYRSKFDCYIVDIVEEMYNMHFKRTELEFLIEASFFELSQRNYQNADENILRINEILREDVKLDRYMTNEVMNLMIASAHLRKADRKPDKFDLEVELENLRLSPDKVVEPPKTPETKSKKPPELTKIIVKDEEIPNTKRRVIKLNLEDANSEEIEKPKETKSRPKRNAFKIPVPVTRKPVLETLTPKPTRPKILVTQPSRDVDSSIFDFATPKNLEKTTEFFTPAPSETPEQFFTPMTSVKTYTKKTLRKDIIKNLESEFTMPKNEKRNDRNLFSTPKVTVDETPKVKKAEKPKTKTKVETGSLKTLRDKRNLKRATSPGKLVDENKPPSNRCRKPVRFNMNDD